jgi:hypothetical protein
LIEQAMGKTVHVADLQETFEEDALEEVVA